MLLLPEQFSANIAHGKQAERRNPEAQSVLVFTNSLVLHACHEITPGGNWNHSMQFISVLFRTVQYVKSRKVHEGL
jgi:hypothetical protein